MMRLKILSDWAIIKRLTEYNTCYGLMRFSMLIYKKIKINKEAVLMALYVFFMKFLYIYLENYWEYPMGI